MAILGVSKLSSALFIVVVLCIWLIFLFLQHVSVFTHSMLSELSGHCRKQFHSQVSRYIS